MIDICLWKLSGVRVCLLVEHPEHVHLIVLGFDSDMRLAMDDRLQGASTLRDRVCLLATLYQIGPLRVLDMLSINNLRHFVRCSGLRAYNMLLLYAFLGTCLRSSEIDTGIGERCACVFCGGEMTGCLQSGCNLTCCRSWGCWCKTRAHPCHNLVYLMNINI